jgi:predicted DNA-binding transcriptional regulator YafY
MNRIDRVSAILIHLQTKKIVNAGEIADRFQISRRTVYRDIKTLEQAGIPIGAETGKGYFITEGYHLPPVMFTKEEAGSLLIASKLVDKFTDHSIKKQYESALFKIKSILRYSDKEYLERISDSVDVVKFIPHSHHEFPNNFFTTILQAIANNLLVQLDYQSISKEELTQRRIIEPLGVCHYSMNWHLIAFCRLRKDYRDFRLDRIKNLIINEQRFEKREREPMQEYFFNKLMKNNELIPVTIRFDPSIVSEIQHTRYYYGFVDEKVTDVNIEMSFLINSISYFGKWILTMGNKAEIITPIELKNEVKKMIEILKFQYLQSPEN